MMSTIWQATVIAQIEVLMPDNIDLFARGLERAQQQGNIVVDLDVQTAVVLIGALQLACRHPAAKSSPTLRSAAEIARALQSLLAARDEELGRLLERGWHEVFDVPREP
jgi:hypothetical protein